MRLIALLLIVAQVLAPASAWAQVPRAAAPPASSKAADAPPVPASRSPVVDRRLALVIGNNTYKSAPLVNPINDARLVAKTLEGLGFEVMLRENLNLRDFKAVMRQFVSRLENEEGTALLYYAGHGVQIEGRNFLLPIDVGTGDEYEVRDESVDLEDSLISRLVRTRKREKIVVLDACRDNPFRAPSQQNRSLLARGFAQMGSEKGSLIVYSTNPGNTAEDGTGKNSIFTEHFAREIQKDGVEVAQAMRSVASAVVTHTKGRQTPWYNSSLLGGFYFKPPNIKAEEEQRKKEVQAQVDAALSSQKRDESARIEAAVAARLAEREKGRAEREKQFDAQMAEMKALLERRDKDLENARVQVATAAKTRDERLAALAAIEAERKRADAERARPEPAPAVQSPAQPAAPQPAPQPAAQPAQPSAAAREQEEAARKKAEAEKAAREERAAKEREARAVRERELREARDQLIRLEAQRRTEDERAQKAEAEREAKAAAEIARQAAAAKSRRDQEERERLLAEQAQRKAAEQARREESARLAKAAADKIRVAEEQQRLAAQERQAAERAEKAQVAALAASQAAAQRASQAAVQKASQVAVQKASQVAVQKASPPVAQQASQPAAQQASQPAAQQASQPAAQQASQPAAPPAQAASSLQLAQAEQARLADERLKKARADAERAVREAETRERLAKIEEDVRRKATFELEIMSRKASLPPELAALMTSEPQKVMAAGGPTGDFFVRGVRLPADIAIKPAPRNALERCAAFLGAWGGGRWNGERTAEIWVESIDDDCRVKAIYARGGHSLSGEAPTYVRGEGSVSGDTLRLEFPAQVRIELTRDGTAMAGRWSSGVNSATARFAKISSEPDHSVSLFANEAIDYGAAPSRVISGSQVSDRAMLALPTIVPSVDTLTTVQLDAFIKSHPDAVLVDAVVGATHQTLPGAYWMPELGQVRLGALELGQIENAMRAATGGDRSRPIIVFERSSTYGWFGYHGVLRLLGMGYSNIYWYRGGLDAWHDARFPLVQARPLARAG